ncbi:alpha/beta hydrolase [Murimonas intestini]|uniref:Acetyl esterase n=1 Tax=Murimonas intestini TaxID=1337051 RepID=A0AB73TAI8_9FIRM|nr:alpha/beta hydrolase [Murimonas intestini]MCR1864237.1 alpha/beta hydrolase [Murimonas intestini]MCR1881847.1 alpha/beta hydrolase [Murimonas intestini]
MKIGRIEVADKKTGVGIASLAKMRASYAERTSVGERFSVPRGDSKENVPVLIYRPEKKNAEKLPVFFNMHGGAWVAGDAMMMESFCQLLAESVPAVVVNINYHKADVIPLPEMSAEACDCVRYFAGHAKEYGIDNSRMAIGGHSAGANIAAGTVLRLKECGIDMKLQILVYPCVDLRPEANCGWMNMVISSVVPEGHLEECHISPMAAEDEQIKALCPAVIVACGRDDLKPHAFNYAKRLIDNGVNVYFREYEHAEHGFLEVNRPDYEPSTDGRINAEQGAYARDCEQWLIKVLKSELLEEVK